MLLWFALWGCALAPHGPYLDFFRYHDAILIRQQVLPFASLVPMPLVLAHLSTHGDLEAHLSWMMWAWGWFWAHLDWKLRTLSLFRLDHAGLGVYRGIRGLDNADLGNTYAG